MSKNNKMNAKFSLFGYLLFLFPLAITVSFSIFIFHSLYTKGYSSNAIALFIVLYIIFATLLFSLVDIIRRKIMIDRPVEQILDATQKIAVGDFNIKLIPLHSYYNYDAYDLIMENINIMTSELSKNEILKTEFISNVSHEIKTPLAVIQNYAKLLKNEELSEKDKEKYLEILVKNTKKLSNLVTNVLKLNKLENQKILPEKKKINIGELLRENILQFEEFFEKKNIELNCDISDIILLIEPSYLELIFNNLISNAIKFTDNKGHINITLKAQNEYVVFTVKDDGLGMNKEVGAHIFEKFYQGDTSHSIEGNGLGLPLVKKVIDVMGGEIDVESEECKGSKFTVKLKRNNYE